MRTPNAPFRVIDSHTAGEPTRTIVDPPIDDLPDSIEDRLDFVRTHYDHFRKSIVNEPRGSEVMVGAHLLPPCTTDKDASVIFFNNVGYLGMCGHGMIGVIETLRYLGRIQPGKLLIETVAGDVEAELLDDHSVRIRNVPAYRLEKGTCIETRSFGSFQVDIAYGGNWFCLAKPEIMQDNLPSIETLMELAKELLAATQSKFPQVDHVELFGPPTSPTANSRNFVLCPGGMYDRSPCGTGTSAKLACLALDGQLAPGETWVQQGVLGTSFDASYRWLDDSKQKISPTIQGRAFVNGDLSVIVDPLDPFGWGIGESAV